MPMPFKTYQGSITIYFTLLIAIMGSLLLCLVEASRWYGLKQDAKEWSNLSVESLFAEYDRKALETYDLFMLDGSFGGQELSLGVAEGKMEYRLCQNFTTNQGSNYYPLFVNSVTVDNYHLITDCGGKIFQTMAAQAMKYHLAQKEIENMKKNREPLQEKQIVLDEKIEQAENTLQQLKEEEEARKRQQETVHEGNPEQNMSFINMYKGEGNHHNPLSYYKTYQKNGLLGLVCPAGQVVSDKKMSLTGSLKLRRKQEGSGPVELSGSAMDRLFMQEYIKQYSGNYLTPKEEGCLSYGTEFVIAGKGSDKENLALIVKRILIIREAINYQILLNSPQKQAQAMTVAAALAGALAAPEAVHAIKTGIVAVWALAESVEDVKILLSGKKLPIVKTESDWRTDLSHLGAGAGTIETKSEGLDYENYLDGFLALSSCNHLAIGQMTLMEWQLEKIHQRKIRMDDMIVQMQTVTDYEAKHIFSSIFDGGQMEGFLFREKAQMKYWR